MCALEFPELQTLADEAEDQLVVLGVSSGDSDELIADFIDQTGIRFPVVYDEGTLLNEIAFPTSLSPFPRQVLVDADGTLQYVASEYSDTDLRNALSEAGVELVRAPD